MAQAKKYGTFAGVFTPSILTILGVIMYMRLPWIAGQAGLYMVLGIVLVAHAVSVCTGLSVSSIATDKKVEGGGSYYIISRSLGLSIGGTLGIALFFGLSFSVSLYIIGFSESFNSFWGIDNSVNSIRYTGTIALLLVTTLTFISTSLTMRLQFFILGAIALSLVSVLFGHSAHVPSAIPLFPRDSAPAMMVLFGIFFPAVTGFEAGVSMSGDLKNPKKNIPVGTIAAILVGLLVYAGFPVFLLSRVDAGVLVNNPKILMEISLYPPLVIAGIWAATLSSAIGSILGAPRILQATAMDSITPRIFGKGHGKNNEPRNALLITFLIAEAGILIGELDIIARVVSTFFITTYGFLNFSCAVESWASSDFRPSFKIPRIVSILGALVCLIVMVQLDLLAAIAGTLILGGLFFYLKSRELTLKSGDAWESVWLAVVRMGLFKLSQEGGHQRNFKPNILLFSGESGARTQLVQLGKWISGQLGMVSNFDLIEKPGADELFPKSSQTQENNDEALDGVFIRRQECRNIYEGIDTIARTYGFSGVEPNSVLMGWRKKTHDPEPFVNLLKNLMDLDFNLMLMNYQEKNGFGSFKTIDVWWRGAGNNGNFTLVLLTFILSSIPWREARPRFLIVTRESALIETIYKNMTRTLENARINGEIKVINNAVDQRNFKDIIISESAGADMTILGVPDVARKDALKDIEKMNDFITHLGTTLLIHASSFFNPVVTGIDSESKKGETSLDDDILTSSRTFDLPPLTLPKDELLKLHVSKLDRFVIRLIVKTSKSHIQAAHGHNKSLLKSMEYLFKQGWDLKTGRAMGRIQGDFLFHISRLVAEFRQSSLEAQNSMIDEALRHLAKGLDDGFKSLPESIRVLHSPHDIKPLAGDRSGLKWFKFFKRVGLFFSRGTSPSVNVNFQKTATVAWDHLVWGKWLNRLEYLAVQQFMLFQDIQHVFNYMKDRLDFLEIRYSGGTLSSDDLLEKKHEINKELEDIRLKNDALFHGFILNILKDHRFFINHVSEDASSMDAAQNLRQHLKKLKPGKQAKQKIERFHTLWLNNQNLIVEMMTIDLCLLSFQRRLIMAVRKIVREWSEHFEQELLFKIQRVVDDIKLWDSSVEGRHVPFDVEANPIPAQAVELIAEAIHPSFETVPENARAITDQSFQVMQEGRFTEMEGLTVDLRELLEYFVYAELLDPLRKLFSGLQPSAETIISKVKDALRLLSFNVSSSDFSGDYIGEDSKETITSQALHRIETERGAAIAVQNELVNTVDRLLKQLAEKLNPFLIIQSSGDLRRYIRHQESRKVMSIFGENRRKIETWTQKFLIKLIYSRDLRMVGLEDKTETPLGNLHVKDILAWLDTAAPKAEVLDALPFHYKQLFFSDQPPGKDFWVGRKKELERAGSAVMRFQSGAGGALMVTGERYSGKSSLSYTIARRFFDRTSVFQIFPRGDGHTQTKMFHQAMETEFQIHGDADQLFAHIPDRSVLVFHDLELWWERNPQGLSVMNHLAWLIRRFGHRFFFILNVNSHAFSMLRNLVHIDSYLLDVIDCPPMTVEEIKNLILMRHRTTGLTFRLNGQIEEGTLSELGLARLFKRFHDSSHGNPGIALHCWISRIEDVSGDSVNLLAPEDLDTEPLARLPMEWMVVILQFTLHKIMGHAKLMRLMGWDEQRTRLFIDVLKRAGVIKERGHGLWAINPYLEPCITDQLRIRGLL
jgi:amino acid transporter